MKKVQARVRSERFSEVDLALEKIGVSGLTVAEERRGMRGVLSYPLENVRHLLLTVVVEDQDVGKVVDSIYGSASTRSWGDGSIAVSAVEGVLDIGSGRPDTCGLSAFSLGP